MSNSIGSLYVELGLNGTSFQEGMTKAQSQTQAFGKNAAAGFGGMESSAMKARGSLMLLSQELGVRIPRHLQRLIVSIPGVGAAFAAMLPLAGVVAAGAVILKTIDHFEKLAAAARKTAAENETFVISENDTTLSMQAANLKLDDQIRKLQGGLPSAVNKLKEALIEDAIAVDKLGDKFAKTFQAADEEILKSTSFLGSLKQNLIDSIQPLNDPEVMKGTTAAVEAVKNQFVQLQLARMKYNSLSMADPGSAAQKLAFSELTTATLLYSNLALTAMNAVKKNWSGNTDLINKLTLATSAGAEAYTQYALEAQKAGKEAKLRGLEQAAEDAKLAETNLKSYHEQLKLANEEMSKFGLSTSFTVGTLKFRVSSTLPSDEDIKKITEEGKQASTVIETVGKETTAAMAAINAANRSAMVLATSAKQGGLFKQQEDDIKAWIAAQGDTAKAKATGNKALEALYSQEEAFEKEALNSDLAIEQDAIDTYKDMMTRAQGDELITLRAYLADKLAAHTETEIEIEKLHEKYAEKMAARDRSVNPMQEGTASIGTAFGATFGKQSPGIPQLLGTNLATSLDQLNKGIADLIVTGKGLDFKKMVQGFAESMISGVMKNMENTIMNLIPGMGKLGSSELNPMWVQLAGMNGMGGLGGGGGAGGGFLSGIPGLGFLSMLGLAGGGDVVGGGAYIVGESGPEVFTPGTSGSITPNSALGADHSIHYHIDARGADAGAEQRIKAALRDTENRAVARSVSTVTEMSKRH